MAKADKMKLAGRNCWVAGNYSYSTPVILAFHGALQTADPNSGIDYLNFPKMTGFLEDETLKNFRVVYAPSGSSTMDRVWKGDADEQFAIDIFDFFINKHLVVFPVGFSMGSNPVSWILKERIYQVRKAIIHSGFWPDADYGIPIMGIITANESVPKLGISFDDKMWAMYQEAAQKLPNFVHGYEQGNHRVPGLMHEWWRTGNKRMQNWLLSS